MRVAAIQSSSLPWTQKQRADLSTSIEKARPSLGKLSVVISWEFSFSGK
jgi:hypothetical protein